VDGVTVTAATEEQGEHASETQNIQTIVPAQEDQTKPANRSIPKRLTSLLKRGYHETEEAAKSHNAKPSKDEEENVFFWPNALPAGLEKARVLTWGYDSDISKFFKGAANQNTFYDHARDLLGDLATDRKDTVCLMI
jgi:hypothetical protein